MKEQNNFYMQFWMPTKIKIYNIKILFIYLTFIVLLPMKANAYFDPGTGSYIIQLILAFLASCYIFLKNPIKFIKYYFKKNNKKKQGENRKK